VLRPAAVELVRWLHARHFEAYVVQTLVIVIETAMEAAGYEVARPTSPPAIAFLDLSGYTRMTEASGDQVAAELAARLSELVTHASIRHGGRAVKYLGDGVMFHFRIRRAPRHAGSIWSIKPPRSRCPRRGWASTRALLCSGTATTSAEPSTWLPGSSNTLARRRCW
jgi:adenylate cyclase